MSAFSYKYFFKRWIDVGFSLTALILLAPVLILIAILVKIFSKGPVLFSQERVGYGFQIFYIYKFRTMIAGADNQGASITNKNDKRITRVGSFLRRFKLDELPQLFNVLKGEMSIVGPRPEVIKYVTIYENDYKKILSIKPGLTDYSSLYYRNEEELLSQFYNIEEAYIKKILPQKILLNKKYVEDVGLVNDIKVILKTVFAIFNFKI